MKLLPKLIFTFGISVTAALGASAETLRDAVRFAVTTNPAVKASEAEMRAAAYELMQLRREYLPTVTMNAELGRQRVDDPASLSVEDNNDAKTRNQLGVRAELVLFDGFRRANLIYANAARVDGSIFRLLDASETMALNATEAYIDVHRHRALEVVARRNVEKHEEIGRRVRDLVEGGRLPYSDQLTIEDRTDSARLALVSVQSSLRDANARYERVIGRAPSSGMSISPAPVPSSLVSFTAEAVENSYRVQFARTQIDQSRFQAEAVLSDRLPRVALTGGWVRDKNRNGVTGHRTDEIIGLNMTWLLYQGGRQAQRNALAELTSRAMAEQSVAVRDVTELAARAQVTQQAMGKMLKELERMGYSAHGTAIRPTRNGRASCESNWRSTVCWSRFTRRNSKRRNAPCLICWRSSGQGSMLNSKALALKRASCSVPIERSRPAASLRRISVWPKANWRWNRST